VAPPDKNSVACLCLCLRILEQASSVVLPAISGSSSRTIWASMTRLTHSECTELVASSVACWYVLCIVYVWCIVCIESGRVRERERSARLTHALFIPLPPFLPPSFPFSRFHFLTNTLFCAGASTSGRRVSLPSQKLGEPQELSTATASSSAGRCACVSWRVRRRAHLFARSCLSALQIHQVRVRVSGDIPRSWWGLKGGQCSTCTCTHVACACVRILCLESSDCGHSDDVSILGGGYCHHHVRPQVHHWHPRHRGRRGKQ